MQFGLCTSLANAGAARAAAWDYLEEGVQSLLQGFVRDEVWEGAARVAAGASPLPIRACNGLVPADLKIVGPTADAQRLRSYMETVLRRADRLGIRLLVFGSGAARTIPEGFDPSAGQAQLEGFLAMACDLAAAHGVTIVLEHLNRGECNTLNTLAGCADLARRVDRPNLRVLVDTYHLWKEGEPLEHVAEAMPLLAHVHVADLAGRLPPGEGAPPSDYRPLFGLLKRGGYAGSISVEAVGLEPPVFARVLAFVKGQWREA